MTRKKGKNKRLLLHNTGGIGFVTDSRLRETLKSEKLKTLVNNYDVDVICLTETNKDWRKVDQSNTIWNGTGSWRKSRRVQVGHNISRPVSKEFGVGGTTMVAFDDLVWRITDQGEDDRLLGRWSYITITGKNNLKTTIVTCYCPCKGRVLFLSIPNTFYICLRMNH